MAPALRTLASFEEREVIPVRIHRAWDPKDADPLLAATEIDIATSSHDVLFDGLLRSGRRKREYPAGASFSTSSYGDQRVLIFRRDELGRKVWNEVTWLRRTSENNGECSG